MWSTAVVWRDCLLVCGGDPDVHGSELSTEHYDDKTNTWSRGELRLPEGTLKRYLFSTEIGQNKAVEDVKQETRRRPSAGQDKTRGRSNYRGKRKPRGGYGGFRGRRGQAPHFRNSDYDS